MPLLDVKDLTIGYRDGDGIDIAVKGVSFSLNPGQTIGLVGESGCGKTTIGMTLLNLLPENGTVLSGEILFENRNLLSLSANEMRTVRWKKIAMIFQAAMNALNPVHRVDRQISEAFLTHFPDLGRNAAHQKTIDLFDMVGIPRHRASDFPHQYSGGMKQRAIIAMALVCEPVLLIADEPTTALDVIVQDQILKEILNVQQKMNIAMVFISHDISVVADVCHRIAVMYHGFMVEIGDREEILAAPAHPYTQLLLASNLTLDFDINPEIILDMPEPTVQTNSSPDECPFYPRCGKHDDLCRTAKWSRTVERSDSHYVCCKNVEKGPNQ